MVGFLRMSEAWPSRIKRIFFGHAFHAATQPNRITQQLPKDYLPYEAFQPFLEREARGRGTRFTFLNERGAVGLMWNYGPLRFARFFSDIEPVWTSNLPRPHFLFWQRIRDAQIPEGWKMSSLALHQSRIGICTIDPKKDPLEHLTPHAQRHVRSFEKLGWRIDTIPLHTYWEVAARSTLSPHHQRAFNTMLSEKLVSQGMDRVHIIGARKDTNSPYEAAFAWVDIPELETATHHVSCMTAIGRDHHAGSGLMAWWLKDLHKRNYRFADFGVFWSEGEPHSWKGFSQFKAQFCTAFHDFPPMLRKT